MTPLDQISEPTIVLLAAFVFCAGLSVILTRLARSAARQQQWMFGAITDRHIHKDPIPRIGGVAVYIAFVLTVGGLWLLNRRLALGFGEPLEQLLRMLGPASMLFLVGLWDDARELRAVAKLVFQVAAAVWLFVIGQGLRLPVPILGHTFGRDTMFLLTILWVVSVSNAFNLIDGVDGLASGSALFSLFTILIVSVFNRNWEGLIGAVILTACLIGFLRYNFHPATVFLGDSGSLFLGFMLSALLLGVHQPKMPSMAGIAIPILAVALPLLEMTASFSRRLISGTSIFRPDRDHIHHRLLAMCMSQREVVAILYGCSALSAFCSLILLYPGYGATVLVVALMLALVVTGFRQLSYPEFSELGEFARRAADWNHTLANSVKVRRLAIEIRSASTINDIYRLLDAFADDLGFVSCTVEFSAGFLGERQISQIKPMGFGQTWRFEFDLLGRRAKLCLIHSFARRKGSVEPDLLARELVPAIEESVRRLVRVPEYLPSQQPSISIRAKARSVLQEEYIPETELIRTNQSRPVAGMRG